MEVQKKFLILIALIAPLSSFSQFIGGTGSSMAAEAKMLEGLNQESIEEKIKDYLFSRLNFDRAEVEKITESEEYQDYVESLQRRTSSEYQNILKRHVKSMVNSCYEVGTDLEAIAIKIFLEMLANGGMLEGGATDLLYSLGHALSRIVPSFENHSFFFQSNSSIFLNDGFTKEIKEHEKKRGSLIGEYVESGFFGLIFSDFHNFFHYLRLSLEDKHFNRFLEMELLYGLRHSLPRAKRWVRASQKFGDFHEKKCLSTLDLLKLRAIGVHLIQESSSPLFSDVAQQRFPEIVGKVCDACKGRPSLAGRSDQREGETTGQKR